MKHLALGFVLMLSSVCYADYFTCTITVNGQQRANSADYRGRQTSIALLPYTCEGKIENSGLVTSTISTEFYGLLAQKSAHLTATAEYLETSFKGEPLDDVKCTCGLE